jgi:hypothetical protein
MSKITIPANKIEHYQAHSELVRRGRRFMRARQVFIADPECLPSMIMACIAEGARTRDDIVRNVPRFVGHAYREVAAVLDHFTGPMMDRHYWYQDDAKAYHLHIPVTRIGTPVTLKLGCRRPKPAKRQHLGAALLPDEHF